MSEDVDKLLLLAKTINNLVDIGEAVMKDGKVDLADLSQLGPLAKEVSSLVEVVKSARELAAEGKDLDAAEAIAVVQELLKKK